ncbi:hypothetical protein LDENG_00270620 [Lucifuga dentata]|nr:hypothetical protein LDENG_00270620 [Lucifuga dentata]
MGTGVNTIVEDEEWEVSWKAWHRCLHSPSWREFAWKLKMRYFKTPLEIVKYEKYNKICWRGCGLVEDFAHVFWDCLKLQDFWNKVSREIKTVLEKNISFKPCNMILGSFPQNLIGKNKMYMLRALVLTAHKMVTVNWLKLHLPTLKQWTQKEVNCMESITASLQLKMDSYLERWSSVILYLEK